MLSKGKDEFFTKLQASFNDIVKNGREMAIQWYWRNLSPTGI